MSASDVMYNASLAKASSTVHLKLMNNLGAKFSKPVKAEKKTKVIRENRSETFLKKISADDFAKLSKPDRKEVWSRVVEKRLKERDDDIKIGKVTSYNEKHVITDRNFMSKKDLTMQRYKISQVVTD